MIHYKKDIFQELKKNGYNQTIIQKEKLISRQTTINIKEGKSITLDTLNKICIMCNCQPNDLIEIIPTKEEKEKYKKVKGKTYIARELAGIDYEIEE